MLAILAACSREQVIVFKKPIVVQLPFEDSVRYHSFNFMNGSDPEFIGKSPFSDTLTMTLEGRLHYDENDAIFQELIGTTDTTCTHGLELIPDYASTIVRNYYGDTSATYNYPVYLVNQTSGVKVIEVKDRHLFGIQEALDSNGVWRPIEFKGHDFCGRGYYGVKLYPNEYALMAFPKYQGNFKTKLRVRIKSGDDIYVSQPFEGTINEQQFYFEKEEYLRKDLQKYKAEIIEYKFYGAWPVEAGDPSVE